MDDIASPVTFPGTHAEHGIAVVERRTGVSQYLLRTWERRYGVITPARTGTGQRRYSDQDIERLRLVRAVAAGGRRVGQVIALPLSELRELARRDALELVRVEPSAPNSSRSLSTSRAGVEGHMSACLRAVRHMNGHMAFVLLMRAAAALDARTFIDGVASPLLQIVGDSWERGTLRPVNEHSLSGALHRVLSWRLEALSAPAGAPLLVVGTLPHQRHEFGAMFAAIVAASRQWRVTYLCGDLPISDIAQAAMLANADVVAVSVIGSAEPRMLRRDASQLRAEIPESVPLIAGGHSAVLNAEPLESSGAIVIPDLDAWEKWLDANWDEAKIPELL